MAIKNPKIERVIRGGGGGVKYEKLDAITVGYMNDIFILELNLVRQCFVFDIFHDCNAPVPPKD